MRGAFRRARIPLRPATAPITTAALLLTSGGACQIMGAIVGPLRNRRQVRPSARRWAEQSFARLRRCDFGSRSGRGLEATSSRACAWRRSCGSQPSSRSSPRPWRSACCFCPWLAAGRPLVHARRQLVAAVETLARPSGSHQAGKLARRLTWAELGQSLDSVVTE